MSTNHRCRFSSLHRKMPTRMAQFTSVGTNKTFRCLTTWQWIILPKKLQVRTWCFGVVSLLRLRLSGFWLLSSSHCPSSTGVASLSCSSSYEKGFEMLVGPWLHKSCLSQMENSLAFTSFERNFPRWTGFARTHMFKATLSRSATNEQGLYSNYRSSLDDSPRWLH